MLEKGKKISDYILIEKIGHGAFGDVWLAEKRTSLSVSQFALKFFRPVVENEFEIETIRKELEVWQKISGLPNIISVIEADFVEDYIYIVSEYADGGSLQRWLAANGGKAWSTEQAVTIILEILHGLGYLHRAGFIHRDIKPANILIRKGTFCLADFGVTREIKTHSITLHTAGTYNYMPPEAFNKKPSVSPATDIWAVGAIFQELLTGELPFSQSEIPSLMYSILHDEPNEMPADIPPGLKSIVKRALQKKREDRYASAQEMIDALKEFQAKTFESILPSNEEKPAAESKPPVTAADTVIDESFVRTNYAPGGLKNKTDATEEKQKPVLPANKSPYKTVVVGAPTRKIKRNNLLVAGLAALLIIAAGGFFITANLFTTNASEFFEKGLSCAEKQDYDCAISNYGKAIEAKPDYAEAYKHRALIYYLNGNFGQAIPDYNRAVELNPKDAAAFYGRASAFSNSGEYDRAIQDYTQAIELNPQDPTFVYSRGLAFFNKKEFEKAIEDYDKALKLNPDYAEAYNNRGNAFDELGKHNQALDDYTRAIELNNEFALAYSNRGASYARKGSYNSSIEDLNRAIEINPNLPAAYFNRANIYALKNDYERALTDYNRVVELNPNNAMAFSNRGVIWGSKGNYAQAIEDYTRAIELNPQDDQNYYNRAIAFEKIGNKERAQSDRQQYNNLRMNRK